MDVKLVKLVNGEEIIGQVDINSDTLTVKKPVRLIPTQQQGGGIAMIPWMMFSADDTFSFCTTHILLTAKPDQDIINEYNKQFGSGVVIPTPQETNIITG